jgi:hypothetical protein
MRPSVRMEQEEVKVLLVDKIRKIRRTSAFQAK